MTPTSGAIRGARLGPGARAKRFGAVVRYTLAACLPTSRRLALLLPCAGAVLFGLLARFLDGTRAEAFASAADLGLFALVLPIGCLVIGDAVLGAEVRSGALSFTWLSPTPFATIVVGRWLAGFGLAAVTIAPAMALAALAAGAPGAVAAIVVATLAGCAAYLGLFVFIGTTTRRAAVWSLAVVFLGERLLGAALTGIAQLSPTWQSRAAYAGLGPDTTELLRSGIPEGTGAVVRLGLIVVVTLALATWRLRKVPLASGE